MFTLETLIGFVAAACTALSSLPQVLKAWKTHSTGDLSLKMVLLLALGLSLWIIYGFMKSDLVIIGANVVSLALVVNLLAFKLKEMHGARRREPVAQPAE